MDQRDTTQVVRMLTPDERKEMLESINSPADLRKLPVEELPVLARALRDFMVESVSKTGGHLSSSLGATELAIALHYVFNTPEDAIVWDVGHQAYAHKILTGRRCDGHAAPDRRHFRFSEAQRKPVRCLRYGAFLDVNFCRTRYGCC